MASINEGQQSVKSEFACPVCSKAFDTMGKLNGHRAGAHSKHKTKQLKVITASEYMPADNKQKSEIKPKESRFSKLFGTGNDSNTIFIVLAVLCIAVILFFNRKQLMSMFKDK